MHAQHFLIAERERSIYDSCRMDVGPSRASQLITKVSTSEWDICISQYYNNNKFPTLRVIHELKRRFVILKNYFIEQ